MNADDLNELRPLIQKKNANTIDVFVRRISLGLFLLALLLVIVAAFIYRM